MKYLKVVLCALALTSWTACQPNPSPVTTAGPQLASRVAASKAHARYTLGDPSSLEGIIIKFAEGTGVRARAGNLVAVADKVRPQALAGGIDALDADLASLRAQLDAQGLQLRPLFSLPETHLSQLKVAGEQRSRRQLADLNLYFRAPIPAGMTAPELASLLQALNELDAVEIAYAPPRSVPAVLASPLASTPDYTADQGYLASAAEGGIDAYYAWTRPGGRGENARIVDVEYAWNLTHEDLPTPFLGQGTMYDQWRDHGTAVMGMLGGVDNGLGILGIVPEASLGWSAQHPEGVAAAVVNAMQQMSAGDVLLIEAQNKIPVDFSDDDRPCTCRANNCYGPVEWWQAEFDAIAAATANGIIVVEAAGNGAVDLDHPALQGAFDRGQRDSGAIIVGASSSDRHDPLCFTSYGSRVDVNGWGERVMTTGYGAFNDPDDPEDQNKWYTRSFSGTSSASPIAAGAAAALVSIARAALDRTLTPSEVRALLSSSGVPQTLSPDRPVGSFPNLRNAIAALLDEDAPPLVGTLTATTAPRRIDFTGTASDVNGDLDRVEVRLDGGDWIVAAGLGDWSYTFEPVAPGDHQLEARAVDRAGLAGPTAGPLSVRVPDEIGDCVQAPCVNDETLAIPDNEPRGMTSTIEIAQFNAALEAVHLNVQVRHPYRGDLRVTLRSAAGTEVTVHDRAGGSADDLDLTLTLTDFNADPVVAGVWSLNVVDTAAQDAGELVSWSLQLTPANASCGNARVDTGEVCDSDEVECIRLGDDYVGGFARCNERCDAYDVSACEVARCGDGVLDAGEVCDGDTVDCTDLGGSWESGKATCQADCAGYDTTACTPASSGRACVDAPCENADATPIPDNDASGVTSQIDVPAFDSALASVRVVVNITHSYRGDLYVSLRSPSGSQRVLHDRAGGSARDLALDLTLEDFNDDAEVAGAWTLTVSDRAAQDVGTLESWSLQLTAAAVAACGDGVIDDGEACDGDTVPCSSLGSGWESGQATCRSDCGSYDTSACVARQGDDSCVGAACGNSTSLPIPDNDPAGVSSTISVASFSSQLAAVRVRVNITHPYRGDLIVTLQSPALWGSTPVQATLHDRAGQGADDLHLDLTLTDFNQAPTIPGDWTLTVSDNELRDVGTLTDWSLQLVPAG